MVAVASMAVFLTCPQQLDGSEVEIRMTRTCIVGVGSVLQLLRLLLSSITPKTLERTLTAPLLCWVTAHSIWFR